MTEYDVSKAGTQIFMLCAASDYYFWLLEAAWEVFFFKKCWCINMEGKKSKSSTFSKVHRQEEVRGYMNEKFKVQKHKSDGQKCGIN